MNCVGDLLRGAAPWPFRSWPCFRPGKQSGRVTIAVGLLIGAYSSLSAQARITPPETLLGFPVGADYRLATYTQLTSYWKTVAAESDRVKLVSIGRTAEGREQWMAIVSSPANLKDLERYRGIAERLARAEGLDDGEARALAREGRAVVWIDGGLHANETLGAQHLIEHVYQMASRTDEETLRILDDVIQLVVHANPDGMELVSSWYMRRAEPTERSMSGLPRLYHHYVGHDNNRDFYLNAMPESKNMSRVMYREWYPQIVYNHHQTGPAGATMFAPPFRDPHNHQLDPILVNSLSMVGAAMHQRFAVEGKPGLVQREAANFQTWWNGGLRTTAYFHNMIGLLTETVGTPTPDRIPLVPDRLVATGSDPYPILPQPWKFERSVQYVITANRAVLDYASRYRADLLFNVYLMGRNAIMKGRQDSWTIVPSRVERLRAEARAAGATDTTRYGEQTIEDRFAEWLRRPEDRDPRGYVLPADQPDFLTATRFVNALIESGIDVEYATREFVAGGRRYPVGSYVLRAAQAFRAHLLDMLEPQNYPMDIPVPGGLPRMPYDNAGYTLALQMGVEFDRLLDEFECPCARVESPLARPPIATALPRASGYLLSRRLNDSYRAVNKLLAAGQRVEATGSAFYLPASRETSRILGSLVETAGLPVEAASTAPAGRRPLAPVRIGLVDRYGGSMASGWLRWILEQFEFEHEVVFAQRLDAGNLRAQFDVLILPGDVVPFAIAGGPALPEPPPDLPAEDRHRAGRITLERTVPALRAFLEAGGRVIAIGRATGIAKPLGAAVDNHLVERAPAGAVRPLTRSKFFIPGSLLEVQFDSSTGAAAGMGSRGVVMFNQSPVFRVAPGPGDAVRPIAWFDSPSPLRSGWAWGQTYLEGGVAAVEARIGRGILYLYGPEVTFRGQPWGTFKLIFNAVLGPGAG